MPLRHSTSSSSIPLIIDLSEPHLRETDNMVMNSNSNRKRLRFATQKNTTQQQPLQQQLEMTKEECRAVWWTPQEVDCMISKANYSAEESRKNKVLVDALDQALREARRAALLVNAKHREHYEDKEDQNNSCNCNNKCTTSTTTTTDKMIPNVQGLKLWCQYGHSRRGLEKAVSRVHDTTRQNIVNKARSKVLSMQKLQQQQQASIRPNTSTLGCNPITDEHIRIEYEKASRSSVIFAQMIAMADAQASLHPFPFTNPTTTTTITTTIKTSSSSSTPSPKGHSTKRADTMSPYGRRSSISSPMTSIDSSGTTPDGTVIMSNKGVSTSMIGSLRQ